MSVYQQLRPDGRDCNQLRPLQVDLNPLTRSDGSAKVSAGSTTVIASVTGPVESKMHQQSIEILIRPSNGVPLEKHRLLEAQIAQILKEEISVSSGFTVNIYCEILIDDGSVSSVVFNAISLALIISGISLRSSPLSVCVASVDGRVLLDPSLAEERKYLATPTLAFDAVSGKVLGLIGNRSVSVFDALALGSAAVAEILEVARAAFTSTLASLALPRRP